MQEILLLIISFGELQVSIGNFYLGIYAKCFAGKAEPQKISTQTWKNLRVYIYIYIYILGIGPFAVCLSLVLVLSIVLSQA